MYWKVKREIQKGTIRDRGIVIANYSKFGKDIITKCTRFGKVKVIYFRCCWVKF